MISPPCPRVTVPWTSLLWLSAPEAPEVWECPRERRVQQHCEVKGDQCMLVCMCVREGVTTGQPLASEPVDLIGQKKTCPLVEPSLAAAWPFCPCRPSIFFSLFSPLPLHFLQYPQLIFSSSDSLTSPCVASRRGLHPPWEAGTLTAERLPFCF